MERIDKFVSERTDMSRKDVKNLIKKGGITVNSQPVKDSSMKINPETDTVTAAGRTLVYRKNTYIMLNKPEGYVCSTRDGISETVLSLVPEDFRTKNIFPAGRLDKDSKGFVFLTDDGDLAHRMLSPKSHVTKCYLVRLEKEYDEKYEEIFSSGMEIDGGEKCLPAKVSGISHDKNFALVGLDEGKFHQVKRMFQAVGNRVISLFRVQIGGLTIDGNLMPGECLEIFNKDIEKMLSQFDFSDARKSVEISFWSYLINNKL